MSTLLLDIPVSDLLPASDLLPLTLDLPHLKAMDDAAFEEFCRRNPNLRIEQDCDGNIVMMPPVGMDSGNRESRLGSQLQTWSDRDGTGAAFSSSTLFTLPNGARRGPDASWIPRADIDRLSAADRRGFARICPYFVLELRSPSDRLDPLREKMTEYLENGARLGLLIDPEEAKVHVYRPGREPEILDRPGTVAGDPEMPGLAFDLDPIW